MRVLALPQVTDFHLLRGAPLRGREASWARPRPCLPTTATRSTWVGARPDMAGQGVQIVPPLRCRDRAAAIEGTPPGQVPMNDDLVEAVDPRDEYVAEAVELASGIAAARYLNLRIVLTAMRRGVTSLCSKSWLHACRSWPPRQSRGFPDRALPEPRGSRRPRHSVRAGPRRGRRPHHRGSTDADRCALAVPDPAAEAGLASLSSDESSCLLVGYLALAWHPGIAGELDRLLASAGPHRSRARVGPTTTRAVDRAPELGFGYGSHWFLPEPRHRTR